MWDRAVGPMQFIPSTWAKWGSDGNVDGQLDPSNVYDASLAAARYLCAANRDLGTPAGLDEAVLSYNHSTSYLSLVRSWMSVYQGGTVSVDDILDAGPLPVPGSDDAPSTPAPSTPATPPSTPPPGPATPPVTVPTPPPITQPSTPPTTDPTPPPATTDPTPPPDGQPAEQPPADEPAEQCGLLDAVGGLIGGLLGEDPNCVHELELSTPDRTATETAAPETMAAAP
jgi:hypothetical protein